MEEGYSSARAKKEMRAQRTTNCLKAFKWILVVNFLILLGFCAYALYSLYQISAAMRASEEASISVNVDQYFEKHPETRASPEYGNESLVVPDFREWRKAVLQGLENLRRDEDDAIYASYNLNFLLHSVTSAIKNFANGTSTPKSETVFANLTDFEIRFLQEFTKLKIFEGEAASDKRRVARTVKGVEDESACNLRFSFNSTSEPYRVVIKPTTIGKGHINISNAVNTFSKNKLNKDVHQCSFNILYEPKTSA